MITSTPARKKSSITCTHSSEPLTLDYGANRKHMEEDGFFEFCQQHGDLRIEMDCSGEVTIMPPTGSETGGINFLLVAEFAVWVKQDGTGKGFDSSTGFLLPNGARRSPDLSWMGLEKWNQIPAEQRKRFAPVCPDFVVELRSESDDLKNLQAKMAEYIENGALLGWLLDVKEKQIHVFRPDTSVEILWNPTEISGEPVLKGFVLRLKEIWG